MAITHKPLKDAGYVSTTVGALYTAPASTTGHVKTIFLHNIDTTNTYWVKIHIVPSGGSASDSNRLYYINLSPLDTLMLDCFGAGVVLETGDSIQGQAETASKIVVAIHGAEDV